MSQRQRDGPGYVVPAPGPFFVQINPEPGTQSEICLLQNEGGRHMSHWRKRNPTAGHFNTSLVRWSIGFSVVFGTLIALSLHGRV
jgi:hypothetical protein